MVWELQIRQRPFVDISCYLMTPLSYILTRQRSWAERHRKPLSKDYLLSLNDNLFAPLSEATVAEFSEADGNELRPRMGAPAKMRALRSSSALAVNVFQYWRIRDLRTLCKACRIPSAGADSLRFEALSPIAVSVDRRVFPRDPNIDVVFNYSGTRLRQVAIESKFAEAYDSHEGIRPAYLHHKALWEALPNCLRLAERTASPGSNFGIDYAQLLKHVLGLKNGCGIGRFWLVYAWYATPSVATAMHQEQLDEFQEILAADGIRFCSITYQDIIGRLISTAGPEHRAYVSYLVERYL